MWIVVPLGGVALILGACAGESVPATPTPRASAATAQLTTTVPPSAATTATKSAATAAASATVSTATTATTGSTPAATATTTAPAVRKVNANTATRAEIQAALEAAGVPNASNWSREVVEYRPYAATDTNWSKLRGELAKYNPGPGVVDLIISALER